MRNTVTILSTAASVITLLGSLALVPSVASAADASVVAEGKKLAFERKKGNCLSCHMIEGGDSPGTIGPPLIAMKARYPDKAKLRAQINDARAKNPNTIMPPFGPHAILTQDEVDKIAEFIYTL